MVASVKYLFFFLSVLSIDIGFGRSVLVCLLNKSVVVLYFRRGKFFNHNHVVFKPASNSDHHFSPLFKLVMPIIAKSHLRSHSSANTSSPYLSMTSYWQDCAHQILSKRIHNRRRSELLLIDSGTCDSGLSTS